MACTCSTITPITRSNGFVYRPQCHSCESTRSAESTYLLVRHYLRTRLTNVRFPRKQIMSRNWSEIFIDKGFTVDINWYANDGEYSRRIFLMAEAMFKSLSKTDQTLVWIRAPKFVELVNLGDIVEMFKFLHGH